MISAQGETVPVQDDVQNDGQNVTGITGNLRQMIAVLEEERQALASLDADDLIDAAQRKQALCDLMAPFSEEAFEPEVRELARTARDLNEVNRRVRNLLAANVAARLDVLSASRHSYTLDGASAL